MPYGSGPRRVFEHLTTPAVAAGADATLPLIEVEEAGTLIAARYAANADLTNGADDGRDLQLVNRGAAGAGTTVMASVTHAASGANLTRRVPKVMTLSATAADLVVAAGDILEWVSTHIGTTGVADPGGLLRITIDRS